MITAHTIDSRSVIFNTITNDYDVIEESQEFMLSVFYFDLLDKRNPIVFLSLFIFMVVSALITDIIMKRRDYRPFIEGRGNI